jgi:hypothetical protein
MSRLKNPSTRRFVQIVSGSCSLLFLTAALLFVCVPARSRASALPQTTASSRKVLDIIFQGAWAFVRKEDGSIWAVTPMVDGHIYPSIRALNEAALSKNAYSLEFTPDKVQKTNIDARFMNSLAPNLAKANIQQGQAYISFQLPKPASILVFHTDRQVLQDTDPDTHPGYDKTKEKDYATTVVFQYKGADFSHVGLLSGSAKKLTLDVPHVGLESVLFIDVQPAQADEDHSHAKMAFQQLVKMFPPLVLYVNFDPNDKLTPVKAGRPALHHSGADCYAAMLFVDCAGQTSCSFQPAQ